MNNLQSKCFSGSFLLKFAKGIIFEEEKRAKEAYIKDLAGKVQNLPESDGLEDVKFLYKLLSFSSKRSLSNHCKSISLFSVTISTKSSTNSKFPSNNWLIKNRQIDNITR